MNFLLQIARKMSLCSLEVPIVAATVKDGKIISICSNATIISKKEWRHAEFCVIDKTIDFASSRFLSDYDLYVTLEMCDLCLAMTQVVRIGRVFFASYNDKFGSLYVQKSYLNTNIIGGFCERESSQILTDFFQKMRS